MTFLPAKTPEQQREQRQRLCYHLTLLRVKNLRSGEWSFVWECADCGAQVMATTIELQVDTPQYGKEV